ncbi:MAG: ComF family protein, partial [Proteobacteria bacterium]|nr:ComF family protein [Pseudomonadota bacterium]
LNKFSQIILEASFRFKLKSRSKRLTNVQNAFYIPLKKQTFIAKKKLLLIDDVWTTGATIHACCKTLLKYGAEEVRVLTLARVVSTKVYNI